MPEALDICELIERGGLGIRGMSRREIYSRIEIQRIITKMLREYGYFANILLTFY